MVKYNWKTIEKGIRYREHPTRKHGLRQDRYFTLRYYFEGKRIEEALGWGSEGWTLERARVELVKLKEAHRLGQKITTLREARENASATRKAEKEAKKKRDFDEMSFHDFWEQYYFPSIKISKTSKTVTTEAGLYKNWIFPILSDIPLKLLKITHINEIIASAESANRSPRTIAYIIAVISQLWSMASLHDFVEGRNPARLVKKPKQDNRRMRFLTKEEARTLLSYLAEKSPETHDMTILSLFAGLRLGEIQALCWSDVHFETKTVSIRDPKSKKNRYFHINKEIDKTLKNRYIGQSKNEFIFPTSAGKQKSSLSKSFAKAIQELGFNQDISDRRQKIVFHSLRHTFASWLVQKGIPLYTVAELMGHSSLEMTQLYAHLAKDNTMSAAYSLNDALEME